MKKMIFDNNNQIKKSNSFSSMKNPNNNSFNLTFTQFPKKKNLLINHNNYYNNNNKKFNSTLTEWRNNSFNINNNIQGINTNNVNNTHIISHDNLKNYIYNSSAPSLLNIDNNNKQEKKSLILDLDETLVHSSFFPFERASDLTLPIKVDNHNRLVYILRRPYAIEFMKEMSQYYEIIIYTASIPEYASNLLDELDKYNIISKRYYRYNCILNKGMYIKDLRIIGKPFKDLIIIDNNPISYAYNINNGLPILSWYGDREDIELLKLIPLLKFLSKVDDVTYIIPQIVNREKNKIKYSLINKLINNEDSNSNLNQPNNFGGGNKKRNVIEKNENNIKNNNDNEVAFNDRNNNYSNYSNYVNNIPNKLMNNNNNNNIKLKYFNNNINLVTNTKYINNNEVNMSIQKNQKFENNTNKNFNESNELRDSVFSPEEPINLNNIKDFVKEEQKNNNDNYEYLNRTPIIEKKNNKSYTPDLGIHRMIHSKYQENDCIQNKFHKIEENNFKKKTNYIGQKYNDKNYCNNHNCGNKNKCVYSQYKNEINKTTPNAVLNNSMKNNIMKYFIPNYTNNNISNNKNNNNIDNNINNINNNNNNKNYSGKIRENNNNSNYLNNKTYDNIYNNIENKYYNFNNIYTYHNKNGKENGKYNINNNESNIYDNNNINPKNNIINNNHNNFNRQNNNNNITNNNNINQSYNNIYNFYRPKYNLNYINKEDSRDNHIIINNNKNNSNSHNNNIKPYNNKNVNTNNNNYIKEYLNDHNKIIKSEDNFYSEKLKAVNDKINEIRNTLNKTEYMMKERKKKLYIEDKNNKDNSFSNKNEDYFRKYHNINPISNYSEKSNNFNNYNNIKSINNNNISFNNENNISNNNKYDFNIQKENINNIQNQRCPTLNELINYKNYSVEKEESNKQIETYSNNTNQYNEYQDKNYLYNDINYNINNNIYSNYINSNKIKPNKSLLYNDDFNNNFLNYNNKIMNRSFSSFYPKKSINNYINGEDIIKSMNNITNSNPNILY